MNNNNKLAELISSKNFSNFWECLEYLKLVGYSDLESFGVSLNEFGNDGVFKNVAFLRYTTNGENLRQTNRPSETIFMGVDPYMLDGVGHTTIGYTSTPNLIVGLIDDDNINLDGLYTIYRKWLVDGKFKSPQNEIESSCKTIIIGGFTPFTIEVLRSNSVLHFGYDILGNHKIPPTTLQNTNRNGTTIY